MVKDKVLYVYTMGYYSAIKQNEILPFMSTWIDLEGIMLSEIRQKRTNTAWFYHLWNIKQTRKKQNRNELIDTDNRLLVTREEEDGRRAKWVKVVKYMVMDENHTFSGEHTIVYLDIE